jgi:hypothetical protein
MLASRYKKHLISFQTPQNADFSKRFSCSHESFSNRVQLFQCANEDILRGAHLSLPIALSAMDVCGNLNLQRDQSKVRGPGLHACVQQCHSLDGPFIHSLLSELELRA